MAQMEWEFNYRFDDGEWHACMFSDLDDARSFANAQRAYARSAGKDFDSFARRLVVVSTYDFYDYSKNADDVRAS